MSEDRAMPVVERIAHPGASPEGIPSTYVLPDYGVIIDPGPPDEESWETLVSGLSNVSVSMAAIEAVVVTHWHADHAGLAPRLADHADAELFLHDGDAPLVGDYAAERERRVARDARTLHTWGVPAPVVDEITESDHPSPMPDRAPVTSVTHGDQILGTEVVHTPGHTTGHIAIEAGDALFVGDAVLPTYTPNVGGSDTRAETPLSTYLDTLDRLRTVGASGDKRDATTVRSFPGHGSTVALQSRIAEIRDHHAERLGNVVQSLPRMDAQAERAATPGGRAEADASGRTPWQVARALFGEMRGIHAKMGAGEAAAHLDFGVESGLAIQVDAGPARYVRTDVEVTDERLARAVSASRY